MKKITEIKKTKPVLPERKKVAAYCRVSMETERLHHSLSAQISRYSKLIQGNPQWEFAGIYADEGISGTKAEKRPEFMRLIADCDAGKIDIVLTKSISRFARNTVDLLETVRHLKDIGVEIRFEKENIRSLSDDGELMLTLLASFAQEESRSISENEKWSVKKRMEQGIPTAKPPILGYKWVGNHLELVPEEAAVVKRIFQNFLDGKSRIETSRELEAEGIRSVNGNVMRDSQIRHILTNITYTGNMLLQKEFTEDPITKKRRKNKGQLPQYFIENTHEAIIDIETWQYVQDEMERRRALGCFANKALTLNCFSTKIKCGCCGRSFVRSKRKNRARNSQLGEYEIFWGCASHKKKKQPGQKPCTSKVIREFVLKEEIARVLGTPEFDEAVFTEEVKQITVPESGVLIFEFNDGTTLEHHWSRNLRKEAWNDEARQQASAYRRSHPANKKGKTCFTSKIHCEKCGGNFHRQSVTMADGHKNSYWHCCGGKSLRDDHLRELTAEVLGMKSFDEAVFLKQIDCISVRNTTHLTFHFHDGQTIEREYAFGKEGVKWSPERREKQTLAIRESFTPERKQKMSEKNKE